MRIPMPLGGSRRYRALLLLWLALLPLDVAFGAIDKDATTLPSGEIPAQAPPPAEYLAAKQKANSSREASFLEIASRFSEDEQMKMLQARLASIDFVVRRISEAFQAIKSSELDGYLAETMQIPGGKKPAPRDTASELMTACRPQFEASLSRPPLSETEMSVVAQYYGASLQTASDYIAKRGAVSASLSDTAMTLSVRLGLVLPFLHISDSEWNAKQIEQLPEWMRIPDALSVCEAFSLENRRYVTAFSLADYRFRRLDPNNQPLDEINYLTDLAIAQGVMGNSGEQVSLLQAAIEAARKDNRMDRLESLRLRKAEALMDSGQQALAAAEFGEILKEFPDSPDWSLSAMKRMTCLLQAQAHETVVQEIDVYRKDSRCQGYLPQLTYIAWTANRKLNRRSEADVISKWFLQEYPDHWLGADIVFADAMTKVAEGDYPKATDLLNEIEARYPGSSLIPKVQEIRSRLDRPPTK